MLTLFTWLSTRLRRDEGATMIEYALIVVAIALVVYGAAQLLGNRVDAKFDTIIP